MRALSFLLCCWASGRVSCFTASSQGSADRRLRVLASVTEARPPPPLRVPLSSVRMADDDDGASSFSEAFNKLAKAARPKKPGEGAPTRTDVEGLPIRLGGSARDGSLGDLRAAAQNWEVLRDPRNWEAEEYGLLGVIAFTVAAIVWGYATYVAPPPADEMQPSKTAGTRGVSMRCVRACVCSLDPARDRTPLLRLTAACAWWFQSCARDGWPSAPVRAPACRR